MSTLLVVEDNEWILETLVAHFRAGGRFDPVLAAGTGAAALRAAAGPQLAAVVLDLSLPDTRGTTLIPALRANNPRARIIVFSADAQARIESERAGADGFVVKGARLSDLAELDRLLEPADDGI